MANFLRDSNTSEVYLEQGNPVSYWTAAEWATEIAMREQLLAQLKKDQPKPKTIPDQECLDLWNSILPDTPEQIKRLEDEIREMKAV